MPSYDLIITIVSLATGILSAVIFHEYAHGWMANRLGDPTAKLAGRLTLNPIAHIDLVGTVILPTILIVLRYLGIFPIVFGWAKPVPVNFMNLRNPKRDMIYVALAGPAANVILAIGLSLFLRVEHSALAYELISFGIFINMLLAIFNMIPVPPLDGSRVVMGLLPNRYARSYMKLERYGILIVVVLLSFGLFEKMILPLIYTSVYWLGVR